MPLAVKAHNYYTCGLSGVLYYQGNFTMAQVKGVLLPGTLACGHTLRGFTVVGSACKGVN